MSDSPIQNFYEHYWQDAVGDPEHAQHGTLILTAPYHGLTKNLTIALRNFDHHFNPSGGHIRFFTRTSLRRLLEKHGFVVTTMQGLGRRAPFWMSHWVVAHKGAVNETHS